MSAPRPHCLPSESDVYPGEYFQLVFVTKDVWNPLQSVYENLSGAFPFPATGTSPPYATEQSTYDSLVNDAWLCSPLKPIVEGYLEGGQTCDFRAIVSTAPFQISSQCPALGSPGPCYPCSAPPGSCDLDSSSNAYDLSQNYYPTSDLSGLIYIYTLGTETGNGGTDVSATYVAPGTSSLFNIWATGSSTNLNNPINHTEDGDLFSNWTDCSRVWTGSTPAGNRSGKPGLNPPVCAPYPPPSDGVPYAQATLGFSGAAPGSNYCFWDEVSFWRGDCDSSGQHWINADTTPMTAHGATHPPFSSTAVGGRLYAISKILRMPGHTVCPGPPPVPPQPVQQGMTCWPISPPTLCLPQLRPLCLPTKEQVPPGETFQLIFVTSDAATHWNTQQPQHPHHPPFSTCHQDYDNAVRHAWQNSDLHDIVANYLWNEVSGPQDLSWNALVSTQSQNESLTPPADLSNCRDWDMGYRTQSAILPSPCNPDMCPSYNHKGIFTLGDCSRAILPCISNSLNYSIKIADSNRVLWQNCGGNPCTVAVGDDVLLHAIDRDENGSIIPPTTDISFVWTGTKVDGSNDYPNALGWGPPTTDPSWCPVNWAIGNCLEVSGHWIAASTTTDTVGGGAPPPPGYDGSGLRLYAISNVLIMPDEEPCPPPLSQTLYIRDATDPLPLCLPDLPEGSVFQMVFVTSQTWFSGPGGGPPPFSTRHCDYDQLVQNLWDRSDLKPCVEHFLKAGLPVDTNIKWYAIVSTSESNNNSPTCDGISNAIDYAFPGDPLTPNDGGIWTFGDCSYCVNTIPKTCAAPGQSPLLVYPINAGLNPARDGLFGAVVGPCGTDPVPLYHPINVDENGKMLSGTDPSFVWTGTCCSGGVVDGNLGLGFSGDPSCCTAPPSWTLGNMHSTDASWCQYDSIVGGALPGDAGYDSPGFRLYAISEYLAMPKNIPTPIDPATIPLVHNRIGVCRPLCMIRLPGGITGNVVQPAPIQMSTKIRNTKRLISARGWRSVTLEQYNNIKSGKATFLGGCYKKK